MRHLTFIFFDIVHNAYKVHYSEAPVCLSRNLTEDVLN